MSTTSRRRLGAGSSTTSRRRLGAAAIVAAFLATILLPLSGIAPAAEVRAAATDLTLVTDATYELRPDTRLVHVTVAITARNNTTETRTRKFYFEQANLAVLPGISGAKVTGVKGATVKVTKATATYTMLRIGFGSRLYSGQARTYTLSFDVKDAAATPGAIVRIGGTLASFPVWAFASDGATGSTVSVVFPPGYTVSVTSGQFDQTDQAEDGTTTLSTGPLDTPLTFFAYVNAQRPPEYADTPLVVDTGGMAVALTLRSWADDPAWSERVGAVFAKALPALRAQIGLPWPHDGPVVVQEAESRVSGGYSGLYDPSASRIEVAYWADAMVVVHEAAHGWFNGTLLADRWANEGFASLYASRVAAAVGAKDTSPVLDDADTAARIPLNAWAASSSANDPATEAYGYAASLELARLIADRAGDDVLRRVWADAASGTPAYQPPPGIAASPPDPETGAAPPDWRGLLDLLEANSGKDFTDLWRTWVVRDDEAALLDARAEARIAYNRTLALANGWVLPRTIRDALRAWQFDTARVLMADARTVLAQRVAVAKRAALDDLVPPGAMQVAFEAGRMADASREAQAELNALLSIEGAAEKEPVDPDVLTRLGLVGAEPAADLASARAAFEAGDLEAAVASSLAAKEAWGGAWQEGRRRALVAVAALATVLVIAVAIAGGLRRARRDRRRAAG